MKQEYRYEVIELGPKILNILGEEDSSLIDTYRVGYVSSFNPDESRLDVDIYDLNGNLLDSFQDTRDYAIRGVEQGDTKVNQLEVDPVSFVEDRTYLGDVVVEYKAFDNAFGKGAELYLFEASTDRTELRAKSTVFSSQELRYYTNLLQSRLNNDEYFYGAVLEIAGVQIPILNATTEVVDSETIVTLKLYEPLPSSVALKTKFQVLESLGEPKQFRVHRELVVIEDALPNLKGPNFGVDLDTATVATDYKNYLELLSQKSWESSKELYTTFKTAIQHTSVDYEDFSDFIHFSSAFERLENARYKFEKIFDYQIDLEASQSLGKIDDVEKLQNLINGLIENFDHYENYLWFESGSAAWPKKLDTATGTTARPFVNVDHYDDLEIAPGLVEEGYGAWYDNIVSLAEGYDNSNKDLLISTVPAAIREDLDNNEPYLIFIHMIGQHFDDLWIYARAITDRYNEDNRLDFGISKELVKDALEAFGVELYETNQNLNALFELCNPDGTYDWGEELAGKEFIRATDDTAWIDQPLLAENYAKRVYKRIYHNIPALLKMKGTSRGLRVLLNCFGIPNDILTFRVQGGTNSAEKPFFGPEETVNIFDEDVDENGFVGSPANSKKIRTDNKNEPILEYAIINGSGSFYRCNTLSRYVSVTSSKSTYTDDSHKVEVGFDLNEAANRLFEKNLSDFSVDDVIGDPRNKLEHYGDPWKVLREALLVDIPEGTRFRTPAAIIRLVRYFDSTFFRMLKDFIPARASIDSGVIVKDNLLHRNRWKGTTVTWTELTKSGSISGSTIYASHGGSFRHAGYKFDTTTGSNIVSTGDRWVDKPVLSGSREINGELAGSKIAVTDGDLSKFNKHRKDLQPFNNFPYQFWFLDLPDPPFCRSKAIADYFCEYWKFSIRGQWSPAILANVVGNILTPSRSLHVFSEKADPYISEVEDSHWTSDRVRESSSVFMGWYKSGSVPQNFGKPETPGRTLDLLPFVGTDDYAWVAQYLSASNSSQKILWMEQVRPENQAQYQYYSGESIIVAWKLLPKGVNPHSASTSPTSSVISTLGGVKASFLISDTVCTVTLPDSVTFGTNNGYYWVQGITPAGEISNFGIEEVGSYTGPYKVGNSVVDATWFDSYVDWIWNDQYPDWPWPITVGSRVITPERKPLSE